MLPSKILCAPLPPRNVALQNINSQPNNQLRIDIFISKISRREYSKQVCRKYS